MVLKAYPGAAIFGRDMLFDIPYIADRNKAVILLASTQIHKYTNTQISCAKGFFVLASVLSRIRCFFLAHTHVHIIK